MLFSFNELKSMASLPSTITIEEVTNAINSIGFEVESFERFTDVEGLMFGKVLNITKNPQGDKLFVCEISFHDKTRIIQTTANNLQIDDLVVAFVPGSKKGDIVFEGKELKGIVSEGMLTAPVEFGIDESLLRDGINDGIYVYNGFSLAEDPIESLGLDDYIIDVSILSNRADAASYMVMAMELAAFFNTEVILPKAKMNTFESTIEAENGIGRSLTMIEAVNDFEISIQEQLLLAKSGIKSINNIVDLTNLNLIMSGQPTHAYDKEHVGNSFTVEKASGTFKVFGGKEVELKDDVVIKSDGEVVSVAGIIGLENKSVLSSTKEFVIEMGRFDIKDIREAIKSVKLNTMASSQSSKLISIGSTYLGVMYLSSKLNTHSNPINLPSLNKEKIAYSPTEVSKIAGFNMVKDIKYDQTIESLKKLGFKFEESLVVPPIYRYDIEGQQDLNEEVFRFYGYDHFNPHPPKIAPSPISVIESINSKVAAQGYQEVMTYSLVSNKRAELNIMNFTNSVKLETFLSKEREVIRNSLITSLIEIIEYNQKRKMDNLSLFDIGMVNDGHKYLGLASTTKTFEQMAIDIKNIIGESIVFKRLNHEQVHPGVSAQIFKGEKLIGWIGKVHPSLSTINAFVAEVLIENKNSKIIFKDYSNDPLKTRDITFELSQEESIGKYVGEIKEIDGVFEVEQIDVFKKENMNSITLRVTADPEAIKIIDEKYNN